MAGSFLIDKQSVISDYAAWVSDNLYFEEEKSFADKHVEEIGILLEKNGSINISSIMNFLKGISKHTCADNIISRYLVLVFLIQRTDVCGTWEELILERQDNETVLLKKDYLTPPNLYVLEEPLNLIFYGDGTIERIPSSPDEIVFKKNIVNGDIQETTLNFMMRLI